MIDNHKKSSTIKSVEEYRSGYNETDSKSVRQCKLSRGFESHLLRQKNIAKQKLLFCNIFLFLYAIYIYTIKIKYS